LNILDLLSSFDSQLVYKFVGLDTLSGLERESVRT